MSDWERPLQIALVSRYYPPDPGGGLALYTQQIAREFVRQGHQVLVISASDTPSLEVDSGVEIHRIRQHKVFQRSLTGTTCVWNSWRIAEALKSLNQRCPLDIIQCPATFYESLAFGLLEQQEFHIPLMLKFHENRETYERVEGRFRPAKAWRRQWLKQLMRRATLRGDYWLGVSRHALHGMLDYLKLEPNTRPTGVSPSSVDTTLLQPMLAPTTLFETHGLPTDIEYLFYSGRLIHEKGLHLLVEAFLSTISSRFPRLYLLIAGEFDYRQPGYEAQVRRQMAGHPAAQRIVFLGRVSYDQMPYWYSHCKLMVAPSFCEPFGRVFVEAMACEAPVVGFNTGGPKEIITQCEDGYLIDEQNPNSLAQAICLLLDSPELLIRIRQNGRRKVERQFSNEVVATGLLKLYQQLIREQTRKTNPLEQ